MQSYVKKWLKCGVLRAIFFFFFMEECFSPKSLNTPHIYVLLLSKNKSEITAT